MENEKKNVLIVGSGAVPVVLAQKLSANSEVGKIFIAPGNGVSGEGYENVDIREDDLTGLLKFVLENEISLTVPTSEKAIKSDIASFFATNGQNIFAPSAKAAEIALDSAECKKFLYKIRAQVSKFGVCDKWQQIEEKLSQMSFPVIVKTCQNNRNSGSRFVCTTTDAVREFSDILFSRGEANVLIEEFTFGHNFTVYFVTDGYKALPITAVGNYRFQNDGDGGLLTSGSGCYAPDYKISRLVFERVGNIVANTLNALERKGCPYMGILGVECTLSGEDKFIVGEFKPFLSDFDARAVLNSVDENLFKVFNDCINGLFADEYEEIKTSEVSSVGVVVSSRSSDKKIEFSENFDSFGKLDFINVKASSDDYFTRTGEVFVLTENASTLTRARNNLYEELSEIKFDGMKYRKDIAREVG